MIRFFQIALVISILVGATLQKSTKALASSRGCKYQLTFHDEFNGTNLDPTKWNAQYPSGNGGEQQFYTPEAISLLDGVLKITAEKRSIQGYPFTSGIITTQGTFSQQYGFFSMRAKLPNGQGFWPAFWMLPAKPAYPAEIDILEMLGGNPNKIYMSNHWKGTDQDHQKNIISYLGPDFSLDFHTYSVLWRPTELIWYVDGVEQYRTSEGIPSMPMFLLANLAVGGDWPGNPDETTSFPSSMEIDYIRVYKIQCHFGFAAGSNPIESFIHGNTFESTTPDQHHN